MTALLILLGASFRTGGQGSQVRGLAESVSGQQQACLSHMRFVQHLREFTQRANMLKGIEDGEGIERRHWLRSDGAGRDWLFSDGQSISRPEYDQLVEALDVRGRRKGTSGSVPDRTAGA